jgi:NhaP-type Na+/H+ or K+/H+ antiporter/Trk K+ transport system NAD-binding subunit
MELNDAALTFGLALAAGMLAQVAARHLRVPGIVLLLAAGVLLGPDVANLVRPDSFGAGLSLITSAAVAVILFEGGLNLEIARLRAEAPIIRRLVTVGVVVTGLGGTFGGRFIMGWSWEVAVPFGTLVTVTGPTVIAPLLRRIRVNRNLHTILEAEGVLIDPIGAILAVVALEIVLTPDFSSAAQRLLGIPARLIVGTATGAMGGMVIARLLGRRGLIPDGLESVTTLSLLLLLHASSEAIVAESGIMAAAVAGIVVGNMPSRMSLELKEFKEQLSLLLIGLLFVLLAADVRLEEVVQLGWRGWATVALLMFVVRPVDVAVSTQGAALSLRERAFIAWIGPRGIVAAAVASLFAEHLIAAGLDEGLELRALVFLVIAVTVVVQGLSGNLAAGLLGVRRRLDTGFIIAGANPVARAVGIALRHTKEEVILIDTDQSQVSEAGRQELTAVTGNALDPEVLEKVDLQGRRGIIGLIPNEGVSLMVAEKARRELRVADAWIAVRPGRAEMARERLHRIGAHILCGVPMDFDVWAGRLLSGDAEMRVCTYVGPDDLPVSSCYDAEEQPKSRLLLAVDRRGRVTPVDSHTRLRKNDTVFVIAQASVAEPAYLRRLKSLPFS